MMAAVANLLSIVHMNAKALIDVIPGKGGLGARGREERRPSGPTQNVVSKSDRAQATKTCSRLHDPCTPSSLEYSDGNSALIADTTAINLTLSTGAGVHKEEEEEEDDKDDNEYLGNSITVENSVETPIVEFDRGNSEKNEATNRRLPDQQILSNFGSNNSTKYSQESRNRLGYFQNMMSHRNKYEGPDSREINRVSFENVGDVGNCNTIHKRVSRGPKAGYTNKNFSKKSNKHVDQPVVILNNILFVITPIAEMDIITICSFSCEEFEECFHLITKELHGYVPDYWFKDFKSEKAEVKERENKLYIVRDKQVSGVFYTSENRLNFTYPSVTSKRIKECRYLANVISVKFVNRYRVSLQEQPGKQLSRYNKYIPRTLHTVFKMLWHIF